MFWMHKLPMSPPANTNFGCCNNNWMGMYKIVAKIVAGNGGKTSRYGSNGTLWCRPCNIKWNVQTAPFDFVESKWNTHRCSEYSTNVHKNMPNDNCNKIKPCQNENKQIDLFIWIDYCVNVSCTEKNVSNDSHSHNVYRVHYQCRFWSATEWSVSRS